MTNFNYKKFLTENKLTQTTKLRAGMLAEGQFSWMTQDTGQQIGSQEENMIPVHMYDNEGNSYYESNYDGYGEFGGMDYYELLDKMNGGSGDRSRGIDLAFDKIKTDSEILYPALVSRPNFDWKSHDFTKEAKHDPNQSWYMEPEEEDYNGEDDYDYSNDYDENKGDGYIDDNDSEYDTGVDEGKKEYYKDAEADDAEHIKALEKDMKDDKKSNKMKMSELKTKIKEMVLSEMNINEDTFAPESEEDFLAEVDRILAEADEEVAVDGEENINVDTTIQVDPNVKAVQDALTQAQAAAQKLGDPKLTDQIGNTITFFTRAHVVEKGAVAEGEEMEEIEEGKLTDQDFKELKAQQDILKKVSNFYREKATKLGVDRKLIGDFNAAISALEDTIFKADYNKVDETSIVNEVEGKLVDEKTGEEVTLPYETLDFRGDKMTVISFRAPHKPSSTGRIYTKGGGEYFPSVAGLKIIDHSFSEDLNESMFPMLKRILK